MGWITIWVLYGTPAAHFTCPIVGLARRHGTLAHVGSTKIPRHARAIPSILYGFLRQRLRGVRLDTLLITSLYWFGYERVGRLIKDASHRERGRPVSQYLVLRFPLTNLPFLVALRFRDSLKSDTAVFDDVGNQWPCQSSGRTSRDIVS